MAWLTLLGVKAKVILGGLTGSILSALALKFGPSLLAKEEDKLLAQIFNPNFSDPKEKELWVAAMKANAALIAYKLPDAGLGEQRKAVYEAYLKNYLPDVAAHVLVELGDQGLMHLDQELKQSEGNQPGN